MKPRILIAGVGNIFLGDDAFGVEVVREMAGQPIPSEVRVVDFGIRGLDLTYALLEDYDAAILVDAAPRGQAPGTLYVIEPETPDRAACADLSRDDPLVDAHGMHPEKILRLVVGMGGRLRHVLIVGCEPTPFDPEQDMDMSLSPPVQRAIPEAIQLIQSLIANILSSVDQSNTSESKGVSHVAIHDTDGRGLKFHLDGPVPGHI
jgi:hydrogenase maturation protease